MTGDAMQRWPLLQRIAAPSEGQTLLSDALSEGQPDQRTQRSLLQPIGDQSMQTVGRPTSAFDLLQPLRPVLHRTSEPSEQPLQQPTQPSVPLNLLQPLRTTIQRETTTTSLDQSSSAMAEPEAQEEAMSEQDIDQLARQIYARLRTRLMIEAERLGR